MATLRKETSTNYSNQTVLRNACVVNETLERLSPRWKMQVLFCIHQGQNRFSLLKDLFPTLADHVLGLRLRELELEDLVVKETDRDAVPPQVRYFATPKGVALLAIMKSLTDWENEFPSSSTAH
ncbi:winged helix-turn-helix transcriptional regulator [uncultured Hymenobacter sp.]|uniref:winged helix-turn-helix transcriptional regulator n=1 Tax=uncultured Hymenobacter sp. TaxID=170016 RepID=UPI0035CAF33A